MPLIDIGSQKQLLLDDYIVESLTDTRRALNPAEKVEDNPVLESKLPWEERDLTLIGIAFDPADDTFKMWYRPRTFSARRGDGQIVVSGEWDSGPGICLATSDDGVHWERPSLGLVEYDGSKQNNILPPWGNVERLIWREVMLDPHESDPARRFKSLVATRDTTLPRMTLHLFTSPNGITWTGHPGNPVIDEATSGVWGPVYWDSVRETYAALMENCLHRRCPYGKRVIGRSDSPDMVHWSEPETILVPDDDDPPDTEFYGMFATAYERLDVASLWIFKTTDMTHHPQFVFSRDGVRYDRRYKEPFILRGSGTEFDSVSLYGFAPIVHGDRILTYYMARNWRSPETLIQLGDRAKGAIGLAVSRLDGFVSLDGAKGVATDAVPLRSKVPEHCQMVTRAFGFSGSRLHLNVEAAVQQWGAGPCEVRVQVLTSQHNPIPGFDLSNADPITTSGIAQVVSWNGSPDVSSLAGRPIKLRIYFKNAKLYSFQFR